MPRIAGRINKPALQTTLKKPLHRFVMLLIGSPLKVVNRQVELFPLLTKFFGHNGGEFLWRFVRGFGRTFYFLTVFICASSQHDVETLHGFIALNCVSSNGRIGVADVWRGVDVVNRCGQIIFFRHGN